MEKNKTIRYYKPFPLKYLARMKVLGWFIITLSPLLFFYKYPENTPFSFFIEFLLFLFGAVILKDCWIAQEYWRSDSDES